MRGLKEDSEEAKCREFVQLLNQKAIAEPPRYHYMGLIRELTGDDFPDCQVKDRLTGKELKVELTGLTLDWVPPEQQNMLVLQRRLGYELRGKGYEVYRINLQTRNFTTHPLANLDKSTLDDVCRTATRFFIERRDWLIERVNIPIVLEVSSPF